MFSYQNVQLFKFFLPSSAFLPFHLLKILIFLPFKLFQTFRFMFSYENVQLSTCSALSASDFATFQLFNFFIFSAVHSANFCNRFSLQHSHCIFRRKYKFFVLLVYYSSSVHFSACFFSYKSWAIETKYQNGFLRTSLLVFFFFLPFILLEIFSFYCKIVPIHPDGEFFKFHSAITSAYIQLSKPFNYQNVKLFKLFQPCALQLFNFSAFSKKK